MRHHFYILLLLVLCANLICAQDAITQVQNGKDLNVLYRNEATGGLIIHSSGFGINYRRGKHVTELIKRYFEIEGVNIRHTKEVRTINPYFENSKGYYYGKLINFQTLRIGVGLQHTLFKKIDRRNIEIRYCYYLGGTLGIGKPIYLEILHDAGMGFRTSEFTLSTEKYDPNVHMIDSIYGGASYFKGIDELQFYPGGYAKFGVSFEYGDSRDYIKGIEVGITLDAFAQTPQIMAFAKNDQFILGAYLHFFWGKRWF